MVPFVKQYRVYPVVWSESGSASRISRFFMPMGPLTSLPWPEGLRFRSNFSMARLLRRCLNPGGGGMNDHQQVTAPLCPNSAMSSHRKTKSSNPFSRTNCSLTLCGLTQGSVASSYLAGHPNLVRWKACHSQRDIHECEFPIHASAAKNEQLLAVKLAHSGYLIFSAPITVALAPHTADLSWPCQSSEFSGIRKPLAGWKIPFWALAKVQSIAAGAGSA